MSRRIPVVCAVLWVTALLLSCSAPEGPGETVERFLGCVVERNMEEAMEILAPQERSRIDEEILSEMDLRSWTIDEVRISSDGLDAEVEFSITLGHSTSGETVESMEWKLHRNEYGPWVVVDI